MPKELLFFCCACCILLLTLINLSVGPFISGKITDSNWGTANCAYLQDLYDYRKKTNYYTTAGEAAKINDEFNIDECIRKKGMHDMEYTSFIFDIVIGFVCGLLGLLHLFGVGNDFSKKTGIIGLICGIIGFILTFVYVILNGIVYTNHYDNSNLIYKRDSEGAFAERVGTGKYKCLYFDKENDIHFLYAKYSDLIQKQYNYDKDLVNENSEKITGCRDNPLICSSKEISHLKKYDGSNECEKLYVDLSTETEVTNKDISDRFLTTLLLSLFVCIANIGLIIFGFLLFKNSGDSTKLIEVKN